MIFEVDFNSVVLYRRGVSLDPLAPLGMMGGDPSSCQGLDVTVTMRNVKSLPDALEGWTYKFVSRRVRELLEELGEQKVHFYPVTFRTKAGEERGDYFGLHPVENVPCMDLERSQYTLNRDGHIHEIQSLHLHEDRVPSTRHFFRMKEKGTVILASSQFAEGFMSRGFTGIRFREIL